MNINVFGIAFTAHSVNAVSRTKKELEAEELSFDKTLEKTDEISHINYHSINKSDNSTMTAFKDPINNKFVIVPLEEETINKLKEHFDENNFYINDSAILRLNGEAEAFVSGWFADIAYNREFLNADSNSDGVLSENEYNNTYNDFGIENVAITDFSSGQEKLLMSVEKITQQYGLASNIGGYRNYRAFDIATSLEDELNTTLQIDKDFDKKITLEEAYSTKEDTDYETVVLRNLKKWGIPTVPSDFKSNNFNHIMQLVMDTFLQKDEKEQEKIISNLLSKLDNNQEFNEEDTQKVYTHERLEHIFDLKEYSKKK